MANDRDQATEQTNDPQELTVEEVDLVLALATGPRSDPVHQPVVVHDNTLQSPMNFLHPENPSSSLGFGFGRLLENPSPSLFSPRPKKSNLGCQRALVAVKVAVRKRRNNTKRGLQPDKSPTVVPPYVWATDRRATVHSLQELESRGIETVVGDVQCKKCEKTFAVGFDLKAGSSKLTSFVAEKRDSLMDRSAPEWDTPACLDCIHCGRKKCAKGVVAEKKRNINWLFLFLGGFLCNCTLQQLKYFCKHTGNHRTGAKNRVLFLTYLGLCRQLDPSGPFDPPSL